MTFFNRKEDVLDIQMTQYGKYLLSKGVFRPVYYAFFDDDILSPTLTSPVPSALSLSGLSNSSETLFSDTFRQTMSSPGSAESHHSYASNLSSSSEASVKTVVRVNSTATVEAEICVNKSE